MNHQEAKRLLDDFLMGLASTLEFRRIGRLEHARQQADDVTALLAWPCRLSVQGYAAFTCTVGLKFECLARWLKDDPTVMSSTVATPIHFLRENKAFTEWTFASASQLEELRGTILGELKGLAIPYIEHYSRLPNLRTTVESANPKDWINLALDADRRVTTLAAIQLVEGDRAAHSRPSILLWPRERGHCQSTGLRLIGCDSE